MFPAAHRPAVTERLKPHRKHRKRQTAAAATATGGGTAQAALAGRSVATGAPDDPATPHHHAQENTLGRRALSPGGLACQVVAPGEAGCLVGRLGVQPSRRRQVAVALVAVRLHRGMAGHGVSPARRTWGGVVQRRQADACPSAWPTATARLSRTTGLSVSRSNSLYHSTICTQTASSAWSWMDDFVKIVGHRETSRFVRTRRDRPGRSPTSGRCGPYRARAHRYLPLTPKTRYNHGT